MRIEPHSKLLLIGDSITDAERWRPFVEGPLAALGNGYVQLVAGMLGARCPERRIRVINMGVSGNTVRDLKARWQSDVQKQRPDWLSIMIGINDVWRHFDSPHLPALHVSLDEYAATLDELLRATRPQLAGLLLLTPFFIEPNRAEPMRAQMDRYGAAVRQLAADHDAIFVDTQAAFDEVLRHLHPSAIAGDRVHPNSIGHTILARAFLNALGLAC
jgi:lysophospholipase L1-like esterase